MKNFKLLLHGKNFSEETLLISSKDYPTLRIGDIVEINSTDVICSPLLLEVTSFCNDMQQKGCISIDQSIANNFQLKHYSEVTVKVIENLKDFSHCSLEGLEEFEDKIYRPTILEDLKLCDKMKNISLVSTHNGLFYRVFAMNFLLFGERLEEQ
ncbi:GATOR complex protein DEPDC5-like isoform X1 [Stegodyphus dumicola]|uniref:GATOR complex protein DEPDC5-like isoform X1 n=1 Tax=Stegodyphus dumicola TaxID=202533 RepID=UPI0015B369A3|nr:GATOR complex protein DEPDC5-like isoform X1 [Stegodyphus dumicola]